VSVLGEADAYTRSQVTYRSGDVTVSGVLLRPRGRGPFPGIVLNHGYIDPSYYVTGQGLAREQDWLARAGFVVLHTDYRGHAASDPALPLDRETRLGYTRDAVNAVAALKKLPYVDDERLAMLGRSMGGGVTMNALVTQPGLVDAAVVYASVSSRFLDNLDHFTRGSRPEVVEDVFHRFGTPQEAPRFYRELSPRTYFDRITEPVLAHHGTADGTCPPPWARTTQRLMSKAGVDSRLRWWEGEDHAFYARWQESMDQTLRFLRRRLAA
jgi:dipeptidyl aminopeptidase/acylaminoacyl peptidase